MNDVQKTGRKYVNEALRVLNVLGGGCEIASLKESWKSEVNMKLKHNGNQKH